MEQSVWHFWHMHEMDPHGIRCGNTAFTTWCTIDSDVHGAGGIAQVDPVEIAVYVSRVRWWLEKTDSNLILINRKA